MAKGGGAGVEVPIGANLGELRKGLAQAGGMIDDFGKGMGRARGSALLLGNAVQQIGGASASAASMAGNLLAGLAMGGPMGLAVAGVNALINHFKNLREEEKKAAEVARKTSEDRIKYYDEVRGALAKVKAAEAGGAAPAQLEARKQLAVAENQVGALKTQQRRLEEDAAATQKRIADAQAHLDALIKSGDARSGIGVSAALASAQADLKRIYGELDEVDSQVVRAQINLKNVREKTGIEVANALKETNKEAAQNLRESEEEQVKAVQDATKRRLELDAQLRTAMAANQSEADRLRAASANTIAMLENQLRNERVAKNRETIEALIAQEKTLLAEKLQLMEAEALAQSNAELNEWAEANEGQEALAKAAQEKAEKFRAAQGPGDATAAQAGVSSVGYSSPDAPGKSAEQKLKDIQNTLKPLSDSAEGLFSDLTTSGMKAEKALGKAFTGIAKSYGGMVVKMLADKAKAWLTEKLMGNKEVASNAAVAASGAAKSQAGIPFVGPVLAMAAMAAMLAAVMKLRSSKGGQQLGAFDDGVLNMLHAKETVLPAPLAEGNAAMAEWFFKNGPGAGNAGGQTFVTINAVDGESVFRVLTQNERQVVSALETIAKNR